MARKIIGIVVGVLLLMGAFYMAKSLIASNQRVRKEVPQTIKTVFTSPVINSEVPILINANGNLVASRKIELFSEVQGILKESNKPFKAGQAFRKGDLLMKMDSREFYSSLLAQRSALYDQITAMMPDLKFDYPDAFDRWNNYLQTFDIQKNIKPLPEAKTDKEKYFVTGKQVVTTYYNIKNQEERYSKYTLRAPFDGVLTESLVNTGTLIRSGQKLGEFVSLKSFELEVAVNAEYMNIMQVGKKVKLTDLSGDNEWLGTVKRVNGRLDQETQTITAFISVSGKGLIEGMYLEANIAAKSEDNAIEIQRNLLLNEQEIFVVENDELVVMKINPVHYTEKTAVIKGLKNGTQIISRPVAGGYAGMPVKMVSSGAIKNQ
ncbi:MAG: efflux RND transporter periplasmic adaptor subunit [Ekhidna sp.]